MNLTNSSFIVDRDLRNYSIFGNLLFAHAVYVQLVCNFHIARIYACPVFKNFLLGLSCNAFAGNNHGLYYKNEDSYTVVSKSARGRLARDNESGIVREHSFAKEGGVKDNGKINLHMYLNNDDSNYIFQAFGSIAAGNAARKACIA